MRLLRYSGKLVAIIYDFGFNNYRMDIILEAKYEQIHPFLKYVPIYRKQLLKQYLICIKKK